MKQSYYKDKQRKYNFKYNEGGGRTHQLSDQYYTQAASRDIQHLEAR